MGSSTITIKVNGQWDGKAIQQAANDLSKFGDSIKNHTKLWESQGQRIATQTAAWSTSVTSNLAKASTELVKRGQEIYAFGEQLSAAGEKLTAGLTVPMVAVGGYAAAMAVQFDTALADVRKTSDMTEGELQRLADAALDLSTTQPVSASQILSIEALGAQLGIADEKLQDFSVTVSGLDIATNLNSEEAATELAQFANITGMADTEYQNFGSTLVALGNNLATTEKDIMNMGLRLAAAGDIAGMSEAEILGLSGAMSSLGIRAEAGGSAMTTIMANISKAAATGGEELEAFASVAGMSAQQFAAAWEQDAMGALTSLLDGIQRLDQSGQDMNVTLGELGINEIRQSDAMRRLASNTDLLKESVELATGAWQENSALSDEVAARNESLASRLQVLKNRIDEIAINIGGPLVEACLDVLSALDPVIQGVADAAQAFADMDEGSQQTVLALAGIAAAAGPVLSALGGVTQTVGNFVSMIGHAGQGAAVFRDALETMDVAAIRNYASAGTLEAKMGLLGNSFVEVSGGAKNITSTFDELDIVSTKYEKTSQQVQSIFEKYGPTLDGATAKVKQNAAALMEQQAQLEQQKSALEGTLSGWKQTASEMDNTSRRAKAFSNTMKGIDPDTMKAADAIGDIGSKAQIMGDSLTVAGSKALGLVTNLLKMGAIIAVVTAVGAIIAELAAKAQEAAEHEQLLADATRTFAEISQEAASGAESQANSISNLGDDIKATMEAMADLNEKAAQTMSDFETSAATLDDYVATINELANKTNLTVTEQERLKTAVAGYNEITGSSVSVTDAVNGKLSEGIDVINANTEAWKRNAEAQALQELSIEYQKQAVEAELEHQRAVEEQAAAQKEYDRVVQETMDKFPQYTEEQIKNAAAASSAGKALEEAKQHTSDAAKTMDAAKASVDDINYSLAALTEAVAPYKAVLDGFGAGFAESMASMGISIDELSVKLQEAGVSTGDLNKIGSENISALAQIFDGNISQMIWAIQNYNNIPIVDKDGNVTIDDESLIDAQGNLYTWNGSTLVDQNGNAVINDAELLDAQGNLYTWNGSELKSKFASGSVNQNISTAVTWRDEWNAKGLNSYFASGIVNIARNVTETVRSYIGKAAGGIRLNAAGGYVPRLHADGAIATRAVPLDIVGEAGAEAIVPLTNRRYAMPFVSMIADETAKKMGGTNTYNLYIDGKSYGSLSPSVKEAITVVFNEMVGTMEAGVYNGIG